MPSALKKEYDKIPGAVKRFLQRALLLIFLWMVIYHLLLQPYNIPDRWLTNTTSAATAKMISVFFHPAYYNEDVKGAMIYMDGEKVLFVAHSCNALELYILYAGFMFCIPTTRKRFLAFTAVGFIVIFLLNIIRCTAITWLNLTNIEWVDFAHHYAFTLIVYICIFYGWVLYTKNYGKKQAL